ncbi:MAG: acetylornithine deacetylase [Bacteroidota bacterium]
MSKVEDILAQLVQFQVLGGQSNLSIIHWIKEYVENCGVEATLVPNETGDKAALHCRIGPAVDGGVILSGHTDVVPVEGQHWSSDPFVLTDKKDGRLYARGACDMKGFLACCLAALPDMVEAPLQRPIYLAFSYDEEVGCIGAPALIRHFQHHYSEKAHYAIIGEPSMMQPIVGQKGIYVVKTTVNGSAGHSSRIRQEVSAIHESARLILWLENKMNELVDEGRIDPRFEPPHSSIHIGTIQGGVAFNIVADKAQFEWDLRTIPKDQVADILAAFEAYCREREAALRPIFPDFAIQLKEHHPPVPPLDTAEDQKVVSFVQKLCGQQDLGAVSFASEAGQFAEAGYESVICGPGSIEQAHRADEFISKEQLQKGMDMMHRLIQEQGAVFASLGQ